MASQLGTGKALGTVTGAEEASRLIGGTPQMGAGTPIGGRSFDLPALRPAASPVNTFFESRGPILGGPVVIPRPPDLPQPSQDMAALAKSLGSFSTALGAMGETYVAVEKIRQDRADIAGRKAAEDIAAKFPGQRLAEIRDQLYKKASAGDLEARAAYERLQSVAGSLLVQAYTNRHLEIAATRNEISTAPDRWAQMTEVPDGNGNMVSKESLAPNHPLILRAQQQLIKINTSDPVIYKQFEAQIYATHSNLTTAQGKLHNEYNFRNAVSSLRTNLFSMFTNKDITDEQLQLKTEKALDEARLSLGPENYSRLVKLLPDIVKSVGSEHALSLKNPVTGLFELHSLQAQINTGRGANLLLKLRVGPNGETLERRLGADGVSMVTSFVRNSMQENVALRNSIRGSNEAVGEDYAEYLIDYYNLRALANNAPQLNAGILAIAELGQNALAGNPAALAAFGKSVSSFENTAKGLGSDLVQENVRERAAALVNSGLPPEEILREIKAIPGALQATIQPYVKQAETLVDEANKPYAQANAQWIKDILKKRADFLGATGGFTDDEREEVLRLGTDLRLKLRDIATSERAKGKSEPEVQETIERWRLKFSAQMTQRQTNAAAAAKPVAVPNINAFFNKHNGWFKGVSQSVKNNLNSSVQNGKVVDPKVLEKELSQWLSTRKLSPAMEFIIKTSGYGGKVDQFFEKQWKNSFPDVPFPTLKPEERESLKDLRLSSATPAAPAQNNNSFPHSLANNFFNALTGTNPAAAATMPTIMPQSFLRLPQPAQIQMPVPTLSPSEIALSRALDINRLRRAIVGKESGGSFTIVNPDSGALGYGQVMPANVPSWTKKHFGRSLTPQQYLASRPAQLAVVNGQILENYQQQIAAGYRGDIAIRRAAAVWYSGNAEKYNDNRKQFYNGREYPSIREYTLDILRRYKQGG